MTNQNQNQKSAPTAQNTGMEKQKEAPRSNTQGNAAQNTPKSSGSSDKR